MDRLWGVFSTTGLVLVAGIVVGTIYYLASSDDNEPEQFAARAPTPPTQQPSLTNPPPQADTGVQVANPPTRTDGLTEVARSEEEDVPSLPLHPVRAAYDAIAEPIAGFAETLTPPQHAALLLLCLVIIIVYVLSALLQAFGVPPTPVLAPFGWAAAGSLATYAVSVGAVGTGRRRVHGRADPGGAASVNRKQLVERDGDNERRDSAGFPGSATASQSNVASGVVNNHVLGAVPSTRSAALSVPGESALPAHPSPLVSGTGEGVPSSVTQVGTTEALHAYIRSIEALDAEEVSESAYDMYLF